MAPAVTPLTDDQVKATEAYNIIMQFATPKGITVSAGKGYWPNETGLPDVIHGVIDQHVNKAQMKIRITWKEASGEERYDVEDLHVLLLPHCEFKLLLGPKGEALRL